jgi:transcriptional regulator with XRE-family HTH domain
MQLNIPNLRLGDQLRAIRRSRNLTQKEVAERAGISQPALSRIELGGGVPDIETLQRLGRAMGVRFRIIVGDENAEQEESLLVSLASRACRRGLREDVQEKVRRLVPALVRDSDSAADRSRDGTITMTKHSEQLPRPAAELERLAEYYDTHDTSTEMDNGDWVEPQPMATTSRLTPPPAPPRSAAAAMSKGCLSSSPGRLGPMGIPLSPRL